MQVYLILLLFFTSSYTLLRYFEYKKPTNYFILIFNVLIPFFIRVLPKFLQRQLIIHKQYLQFMVTGTFLNLLLKIIILCTTNIELPGHYNIVLLLLCITIAALTEAYYYIVVGIRKIMGYCLAYPLDAEWSFRRVPEALLYSADNSKILRIHQKRDRYYFFKPFFSFFILVRYLIIREPYLYLFFHLVIALNYLYDKNLIYTYIYLLIIQISRYIFFLNEFKFSIKEYMKYWINFVSQLYMAYGILIKKTRYTEDTSRLLFTLTRNNMNTALLLIIRYCTDNLELFHSYQDLYKIQNTDMWRVRFYQNAEIALTAQELFQENYLIWQPDLKNDITKFIFRNTYFWLVVPLFVIYWDFSITNILLEIYNPSIQMEMQNLAYSKFEMKISNAHPHYFF